MKTILIIALNVLVVIGAFILIIGFTIAGAYMVRREPAMGALMGFGAGVLISTIILGFIALVLDIRAQLIAIRRILVHGKDVALLELEESKITQKDTQFHSVAGTLSKQFADEIMRAGELNYPGQFQYDHINSVILVQFSPDKNLALQISPNQASTIWKGEVVKFYHVNEVMDFVGKAKYGIV